MIGVNRDRERGCARAREWASQRLDGELSELERLLLRRHLTRCADCRVFVQSIEGAVAAIRAAPDEEPSRPLASAPDASRRRPARRRRQLVVAFALVAVSAAIGGVVGGLVSRGGEERPVITIVEVEPPPVTETGPTGNV